ncbi:MAG: hypothetical protein LUE27_09875 [Clostridia bacterium]|nr:hypothetical protein [Clostridia bacterium]
MKIKIATISAMLGMILFSMAFSSCKDDEPVYPLDGDKFMAWSVDGERVQDVFDSFPPESTLRYSDWDSWINVDPFEESSYTFVCTNTYFTKVKITSLKSDETPMDVTEDNPQVIEGDWFTIDLNGMEMTVSFKPNDSEDERTIIISTNAQDDKTLGYNFTFYQATQEEAESEKAEDSEDTGE